MPKAVIQAFNQIMNSPSTQPRLIQVMTQDMMHDMISAIKKLTKMGWYLAAIHISNNSYLFSIT